MTDHIIQLRYRDVTGPSVCDTLPHIERNEVRYLWHARYYDGPLSGMLLYQGRRCWFENPEEYWLTLRGEELGDYAYPRRFLILELTEAQLNTLEHMHDLFRQYIGTHTDYDERGQITGHVQPRKRWELFAQHWDGQPVDMLGNLVVGWFADRSIAAWMASEVP